MRRHAPRRSLASSSAVLEAVVTVLILTAAVPLHADPVAASPVVRSRGWIPKSEAPRRGVSRVIGGATVRRRGDSLVVRSYSPRASEGGRSGFDVEEVVLPGGSTRGDRSRATRRARRTFTEVSDLVRQEVFEVDSDIDPDRWAANLAARVASVQPATRAGVYGALTEAFVGGVGDPWSRYIPPAEVAASTRARDGASHDAGGFEVRPGRGAVMRVSAVDRGSPAARAGLRPGDRLVKANGTALGDFAAAVDTLRTLLAQPVQLEVSRRGVTKVLTLTPADYTLPSVSSRLHAGGVAQVRVAFLGASTAAELEAELQRLARRARRPLRGLVLDLRGNPGGLMDQATSIANLFARGGTLYTALTAKGGFRAVMDPARTRYGELPLTVLVDRNTMSAAELLAGGLKELGRATVLGERTYGKGVGQQHYPLADGGLLKLTSYRLLLGESTAYHRSGVVPDTESGKVLDPLRSQAPRRRFRDPLLSYALRQLQGTVVPGGK